MRRIRFGEHADFERDVSIYLDGERFSAEFKFSVDTDFSGCDAIVPFHFHDFFRLDQQRGLLGTKCWYPTKAMVELCDDKLALNKTMISRGFGGHVPEILDPGTRVFPYIVKRRNDENGAASFVIRSAEDEDAHQEYLASNDYFCQEYIPGDHEYAIHMLLVRGELIYSQT